MKESIELKEIFNVLPSVLYQAWLSSETHGRMTGGDAVCSDKTGAPFSAWDGYIQGRNIELTENQRIVQSWRTTEFSETDEDSRLEITLTPIPEGTELHLKHTHIPEGQTQYKQGWIDHYFYPMQQYFTASI